MNTTNLSTPGRRSRRLLIAVVTVLLSCLLASCSEGEASSAKDSANAPVKVGVLLMLQADVVTGMSNAFQDELTKQLAPRKVKFQVKNANGDQGLVNSLTSYFAGSDNDAFAVLGTPAVVAMAQQIKDKPIFALGIGDPVQAGVAKSLDTPGGNVTGSIDFVDPSIILNQILALQPGLQSIGTVFNSSNSNMQVWVDLLKKAVATHDGLSLVNATISGTSDVPAAARSLTGRVDAILIGPDAQVIAGASSIAALGSTSKTPVYQTSGAPDATGILASIGPDYTTLGARTGDVAAQVLKGAKVSETSFYAPKGAALEINKTTMKNLGITIPQAALSKASFTN